MRILNRPIGRMFTAACILASTAHAFAEVTWDLLPLVIERLSEL